MKLSFFQIVLFAVFGLAALVGLFVFATYTNNNSDQGVGTVLIWGTLPESEMDALLTTLGQTTVELRNVTYVEKDPYTLPEELASAIATAGAPDLVLESQENLLALAKYVTPLSLDVLPTSTFTNSFIGGAGIFSSNNGYYGIPFLVDPLVLYANRSILASSGIASPPGTWEALTGLVSKVARFTPNRQITRGLVALGGYDNVTNARAILSLLFLQTRVPLSGYGATGALAADLRGSNTQGVPAGQSVVTFYTQFADPSKVSYTWNASLPESRQMFLSAESALYLGYLSEARFLREANPNIDLLVSAAPQPGTASTKTSYGRIYAFMIPRGAANPAGAYRAASLFTGVSEQQAAALTLGLAPTALANLERLPGDPALALGFQEALYTRGWLSPAPARTDQVFSDMISSVISGRYEVDTALMVAERALSAALAQ